MTRYEYLQETDCNVVKLNLLGSKGWELISVHHNSVTYETTFFFKRLTDKPYTEFEEGLDKTIE